MNIIKNVKFLNYNVSLISDTILYGSRIFLDQW